MATISTLLSRSKKVRDRRFYWRSSITILWAGRRIVEWGELEEGPWGEMWPHLRQRMSLGMNPC